LTALPLFSYNPQIERCYMDLMDQAISEFIALCPDLKGKEANVAYIILKCIDGCIKEREAHLAAHPELKCGPDGVDRA
jgi:hypothetical protein